MRNLIGAAALAIALLPGPLFAQSAEELYEQGSELVDQGDVPGAIKLWNQAIAAKPDYTDAYLARGKGYLVLGNSVKAREDLQRVIQLDPKSGEARRMSGLLQVRAGHFRQALPELDIAIALEPENADNHGLRAYCRMMLKDYAASLEDFERAISLNSLNPDFWSNRSLARYHTGDAQGALADADRALALEPRSRSYANRSLARGRLGDAAGCWRDCEACVQLEPSWGPGWNNLGNARWEMGDLRGAVTAFSKAIELNPMYAVAYLNRGWASFQPAVPSDTPAALADCDKAIALAPNSVLLRLRTALLHELAGDRERARALLKEALELAPAELRSRLWSFALGGEAEALKPFAKGDAWLARIAQFLLGNLTRKELDAFAAEPKRDWQRRERACQAACYAALLLERKGDLLAARASYRAVIATRGSDRFEFSWARARLQVTHPEAAKLGDPEGQVQMGYRILPKDAKQAVAWFKKAVAQGYAESHYALGLCTLQGMGVAKDPAEGVRLLRLAGKKGYAKALHDLGILLSTGEHGVKVDAAASTQRFLRAAELGFAPAQYNVGVCFLNGDGVAKDRTRALEWIRKAAHQGNPEALSALKQLGEN